MDRSDDRMQKGRGNRIGNNPESLVLETTRYPFPIATSRWDWKREVGEKGPSPRAKAEGGTGGYPPLHISRGKERINDG